MNKRVLCSLLACLLALSLTGCGFYRKPETHSMINVSVNSITTVCGTDCDLDEIATDSDGSHGTATYVYTNVADNKGISDAKKYHEYLKNYENCVAIDDFDEKKASYTAYIDVHSEHSKEGFSLQVTFGADHYTVKIMDNVTLPKAE